MMKRLDRIPVLLGLLGSCVLAAAASAGERVAIVVGNSGYTQAPLYNPLNDANAVSEAFRELGFETIVVHDANAKQMHGDMLDAIAAAEGAEILVFFYAGHGVQAGGINYLLPTDMKIETQDDIKEQAVPLNSIVELMEHAGVGTGLVFLDACRDNPLADTGLVEGGLAFYEEATGEFVLSYAAAAGAVAYDGEGAHSPYSLALTEALEEPGLDIYAIMRMVRKRVREMTEGRQIPWIAGSVEREIVLNQDSDGAFLDTASFDPFDPNWLDDTRWQSIANRRNPALFARFLEDFPTSRYAMSARSRQSEMTANGVQPVALQLPEATPEFVGGGNLKDPLTASITACDLLAAGDLDPLRVVPGVSLARLSAQDAILACTHDLAQHPNEPRLLYQLARALLVEQRYEEALHYAGLAAEHDYPDAYALLAWMHADGFGLPAPNPERAITLWRHGAELGSPNARANLGRSYRDGFGVEPSMPDAVHWFTLAALAGEKIAADDLGNLYQKGDRVTANAERSRDWFHLGASLGSSNAMTNLGNIYRDGSGVEQDPEIAKYWYRRASEEGNRFAPFHLARMLLEEDADANGLDALNLFMLAGDRGFAQGFARAARMYKDGWGIDQRLDQALFFARVAVGSGDGSAQALIEEIEPQLEPAVLAETRAKADRWLEQNGDSLRIARFAK